MLKTFARGRLVACAFALLLPLAPARAETIVPSGDGYRLGGNQGGSQSAPSITPYGGNGGIAAWVSPGGSQSYPFANYFSIYGDPRGGAIKLDSATGPTSGVNATSTAAVSFPDGSALIFYSAKPRSAGGQDIFAQRLSAYRQKVGAPVRINQNTANIQNQVFAVKLAGSNVLATWLTHGAAPSTFNLRGRVVNTAGAGSFNEVAVTADTAGAQTQTSLAALTNGNSVIAYSVRTGSGAGTRHAFYIQRLGPNGARLGGPKLIKQTTGANTYGGVAVAALPSGRYIAIWFVAANGGRAGLRVQTFSATGVAGPIKTLGTAAIKNSSPNAPRAIYSDEGVIIVWDGFTNNTYAISALLITHAGNQDSELKVLASGLQPLTAAYLSFDSVSDIYYLALSQKLPSSVRSYGTNFYVSQGCTVRC